MNPDSLDPRWVRTWAAGITTHLQAVLAAFDTYYPFPPGRNEVVLAGPSQGPLDILRARSSAPSDLIALYQVIQEVTMPDIGNGIFIHAPEDVIVGLADGPVPLDDGNTGTTFASNGGGILYAIDRSNRVHRSHDASTDSGFEPVATDLRVFLEHVLDTVANFAATRTAGDI
ncbi:hypothetical protein [Actinoplanes sp. NPDC049802]|uniref:hypothetical protein n=1 Tax=Actinoplanes sp. NPDC049802 TaxID=3154742 RepID=UPI0033D89495